MHTDIGVVSKNFIGPLQTVHSKLEDLYRSYERERSELVDDTIAQLKAFLPTVGAVQQWRTDTDDKKRRANWRGRAS